MGRSSRCPRQNESTFLVVRRRPDGSPAIVPVAVKLALGATSARNTVVRLSLWLFGLAAAPAGDVSGGPVATGLGEVFHYIVRGKDKSAAELRTAQDWVLKPQLRTVPGVIDDFSKDSTADEAARDSIGFRISLERHLRRPPITPQRLRIVSCWSAIRTELSAGGQIRRLGLYPRIHFGAERASLRIQRSARCDHSKQPSRFCLE